MADSLLDPYAPLAARQAQLPGGNGPFPDASYFSLSGPDTSQGAGPGGDDDPLYAQMQKQRQASAAAGAPDYAPSNAPANSGLPSDSAMASPLI
jgi:hypothetical protein